MVNGIQSPMKSLKCDKSQSFISKCHIDLYSGNNQSLVIFYSTHLPLVKSIYNVSNPYVRDTSMATMHQHVQSTKFT